MKKPLRLPILLGLFLLPIASCYSCQSTLQPEKTIESAESNTSIEKNPQVRNVVLMLSDGTAAGAVTLSRWFKGAPLHLDSHLSGAVAVYNTESIITDSAPAATAFATGYHTGDNMISVLPATYSIPGTAFPKDMANRPIASVLEGARLTGRSTGLIATANVQHASPAAFSAHWFDRNNYEEIAEQQVFSALDVVFGGGAMHLLPKNQKGTRLDGENLIEELRTKGVQLVTTAAEMRKINHGKVWGLFADDYLAYEIDRKRATPEQPTLAEMTAKSLEILNQNEKGFFLFVEGSKVDWAAHSNDPVGVVSDFLAFDDAAKVAFDFAKTDGNTLVIVVSDHATGGLTIGNDHTNGNYSKTTIESVVSSIKSAKESVESVLSRLDKPVTPKILRDALKQAYGITDVSDDEITTIMAAENGYQVATEIGRVFSRRTKIGWTTRGHTGEDTFLWSYGPGRPIGLLQNIDVAKVAANALGVDLANVNQRLFSDLVEAFSKQGVTTKLDETDAKNPILVVSQAEKTARLPLSRNVIIGKDGTQKELPGLVIKASDGRIYGPAEAVSIFSSL